MTGAAVAAGVSARRPVAKAAMAAMNVFTSLERPASGVGARKQW
jgi:hypothetical protein